MRLASLSLRRKFTLAFLCGALLPLLVFCAFSYFKTSAGLSGIESRQLASSAAAVESGIAQRLDEACLRCRFPAPRRCGGSCQQSTGDGVALEHHDKR